MEKPRVTRRSFLRTLANAAAVPVAAGALNSAAGEAEAAPRPRSLDESQRKIVDEIVHGSLEKTDKMGQALFEAQDGIMRENFRQWIISEKFGRQYSRYDHQEHKRILKSEKFRKSVVQKLVETNLIKEAGDIIPRIRYHRADRGGNGTMGFSYAIQIDGTTYGDGRLFEAIN